MKKFILSLLLVTPLVCKHINTKTLYNIMRCENDEVICYVYSATYKGGISCKFKESEDE